MKRTILILSSAVLALTSACSDPESAARELYDQALVAEREENLELALADLERVVADYPETAAGIDASERLTQWLADLERNEGTARTNLLELNRAEDSVTDITQGGIYALPSRLNSFGLLDSRFELLDSYDLTATYLLDGYLYTFTFNDLSLTGYTVSAAPESGMVGRFSYHTSSDDFIVRYTGGPGVTMGDEVE